MHPIIFQTKYFTLSTFWLFFAGAILLFAFLTIKLSTKRGLKIQFLSQHFWTALFWGLLGARIVALAVNYQNYFSEISRETLLRTLYLWDGKLSLWGGLTAFIIYFVIICKKHNQSFLKWLDVLVPSLIAALALGSLGAFFDGVNYGKETTLPWGVNFESPAIKYTVPIHPTQIYAFLYNSTLAIFFLALYKTKRIRESSTAGLLGITGLLLFSILRFLEEITRGDDTLIIHGFRLPFFTTTLAFLISAGIFIYILYNMARKPKKTKK